MNLSQKEISYSTTNTYNTLNSITENTKNIWLVCHGMGYLGRYFLRYFEGLNKNENYIIAPQAPSKYYIAPKFKHVGASWLTKENTKEETKNIMRYMDSVIENEGIPTDKNLILLGYSQGVSIIMRYLAYKQLKAHHLIIHSGGIPIELKSEDFSFLIDDFKATMIYGTKDEFLNEDRIANEIARAHSLFKNSIDLLPFNGVHEFNKSIIEKIVQ